MKDIVCLGGLFPALLVAEYEINPMMKVVRYILRFECQAMQANKFMRTSLGPRWELDVMNLDLALCGAEVEVICVEKDFWACVKLRNQFLHIRR